MPSQSIGCRSIQVLSTLTYTNSLNEIISVVVHCS